LDLKLTGKIALVTGSTAGIGFGIAHRLLQEGSEKFISDLAQERGLSKEDVDREFFEKSGPPPCWNALPLLTESLHL
jgi:NAD(P)-dependent dehydrogenase (short-subunit alcohol dehydrogenase family)